MAIELHHLQPSHDDELSRLKARIAYMERITPLAKAQHEARHHKYKRCLAMAKLCNEKWLVHNFEEIPVKLRFYDKWEKRWLKLAEKFKEA